MVLPFFVDAKVPKEAHVVASVHPRFHHDPRTDWHLLPLDSPGDIHSTASLNDLINGES